MINGRLIGGKAIVPVIFRLPGQPDFSLDFVIDTGFNGALTLPPQAVSAMNLPLRASIPAMMEGYHLEIDFEDNGLVSLEKIPPSPAPVSLSS